MLWYTESSQQNSKAGMCSAFLDVPRVGPQWARATAASQNVLLQPSMITQTQPWTQPLSSHGGIINAFPALLALPLPLSSQGPLHTYSVCVWGVSSRSDSRARTPHSPASEQHHPGPTAVPPEPLRKQSASDLTGESCSGSLYARFYAADYMMA